MSLFSSIKLLSLLIISISLIIGYLIAYQINYFLISLLFFPFLAIIAWKTEESFLTLIFYLPFQIALNITSNIDLASSRFFIVTLFLVWFFKSLAKRQLKIPHKISTWLIFIFLGLMVFSSIYSLHQNRSMIRLLYFFSLTPLYFLATYYLNSNQKIKKAVLIILFSATLTAIAGLIQFFAQFVVDINPIIKFMAQNIAPVFYGQAFSETVLSNPSWLVNINGITILRSISFFPDPHILAFYLGLIIPLALCMFLFSASFNFSKKFKMLIIIANFILIMTLLTTFSRAGYIGFFFGLSTIIILGWKFFNQQIKLSVSALIIIVGALFFNSGQINSGIILERFLSSFNLAEGSNSERIHNWNQALKIIEDFPLTGVGIGAYSYVINPRSPERSAITAHNTYFDIAAEAGIIALFVWLTLLITTIKKLIYVFILKNNYNQEVRFIALGLSGSLVCFSFQTIFDTAIYSPSVFSILMIYFAIAENIKKQTTSQANLTKLRLQIKN